MKLEINYMDHLKTFSSCINIKGVGRGKLDFSKGEGGFLKFRWGGVDQKGVVKKLWGRRWVGTQAWMKL